jgi:molybdate transport system regulatory protein
MNTVKDEKKIAYKIWFEYGENPVIGSGGAQILKAIKEEESLSGAARKTGMSYRYIWDYLDKLKKTLPEPIVKTFRGGKSGGKTFLTEFGVTILKEYERMEKYIEEVLIDKEYWEAVGLKISARNLLESEVIKVEKGDVTAKVTVKIEKPTIVTSLISREAVEDLNIKPGDHVKAVIKATEVMIAKEKF